MLRQGFEFTIANGAAVGHGKDPIVLLEITNLHLMVAHWDGWKEFGWRQKEFVVYIFRDNSPRNWKSE